MTTLHTAFLRRAAAGPDSSDAMAAVIVLRVVDELASGDTRRSALLGQSQRAVDHLHGVGVNTLERRKLMAIALALEESVRARDTNIPWQPLTSYIEHAINCCRNREALDVIRSALRLFAGRSRGHVAHLATRRPVALRRMGMITAAGEACQWALHRAVTAGAEAAVLRARQAMGTLYLQVGNLPEAQRVLESVAVDARRANARFVEAATTHDLSTVQSYSGMKEAAEESLIRAYELYESPEDQIAVIGDLGTLYVSTGRFDDAVTSFDRVYRNAPPYARTQISMVSEHMRLQVALEQSDAFERWFDLGRHVASRDIEAYIDYNLAAGQGLQRFREPTAAEPYLQRALRSAERFQMNRYVFLAEQAREATCN